MGQDAQGWGKRPMGKWIYMGEFTNTLYEIINISWNKKIFLMRDIFHKINYLRFL